MLGSLIREVYGVRLVPGAEPPGNISVFLAQKVGSGPQELHRLYVSHPRTLRTRSLSRLFGALWHELDGFDARFAGQRLLLDVTTLIRGGEAHLLPGSLRRQVADDERSWARDGFDLVDRRWLGLDAASGTVTVPTPPGWNEEAWFSERMGALGVQDRPASRTRAGTFPIASWTVADRPASLASRVAIAAGAVLDRQLHDGRQLLTELVQLMEALPALEQSWTWVDELRHYLARL
jgi:hypothetical protein